MAVGEGFLHKAIQSEIAARDAYKSIADRIEAPDGKRVMSAMSDEEDRHRAILTDRYRSETGMEFAFDFGQKPGPNFDIVEKSALGHTDALEALSLCLGAEIDAINYYSAELAGAAERSDIRMLKDLVKFEKKHKAKLEKEIKRLKETNHWKL